MSSSDLVREWPEGGVRERRAGNVGVLEANGYVNHRGSEVVVEACEGLMQAEIRHIVLNLEKVHVMNSVGIAGLIEMLEKVTGLGGRVAFCGAMPTLERTFGLMGLLRVANHYTTEGDALASMEEPEG